MSSQNDNLSAVPTAIHASRLPFATEWIQMLLAAAAMVATLPGRSQGLGLVTEKLLADFGISREVYANYNLWATLIGAVFAVGIGRIIDRVGSRVVLTVLATLLGLVVVVMAGTHSLATFAVTLTLTRGLGQSALSAASLTLVGKWFVRRINTAMAVYSIVMSIGFMIAFLLVGYFITRNGWRVAWSGIGWTLLLLAAPLFALLVRNSPESVGLPVDGEAETNTADTELNRGATLSQALATPAFWVIGIGSALYGLIASGIGIFNESILAERGFAASVYHNTLAVTALVSLIGNFLGGALTANRPLYTQHRLMGVALLILAAALVALMHVSSITAVMLVAALMGIAGGFVIVIFFAYWGRAFGRKHLGQIQGVAQALTVLASATGPLLFAYCKTQTGSYVGAFYGLAGVVVLFAVGAWVVPAPKS